jgi:hypothetical protein
MRFSQIWRYLFPKHTLQQFLPLITLRWSSHAAPYKIPVTPFEEWLAKCYGVARTHHDCIRLKQIYRDRPMDYIIRQERRRHRFKNRLARAWQRLKRRW